MQKPNLAIVVHRFGPYHRARIESASRDFNVIGVELSSRTEVYAWEPIRLSEHCRHLVVCSDVDSRTLSTSELYGRMDRLLTPLSLDAVAINGWSDNGALATLQWCGRNGVPAIAMSESNRVDFARNPLREFVKRRLVGNFTSALVGGTLSRGYLCDLGMPRERIFDGYDAIDNDHFARPIDVSGDAIRGELGFPRPYFLASNRFIEKKNLSRLIDAYADYRRRSVEMGQVTDKQEQDDSEPPHPDPLSHHSDANNSSASEWRGRGDNHVGEPIWDLVLLGDGTQKDELVAQVTRLGLNDHVHFPGFRQYDDLPKYYWGANAFVHASTTEQWGLVINEAMAAGLPVIASNRCGSTTDLVIHGETGFVFDPSDTHSLAQFMLQIAGSEPLQTKMSAAAGRHIGDWGSGRFASGMKHAAGAAITHTARPTMLDRFVLSLLCR